MKNWRNSRATTNISERLASGFAYGQRLDRGFFRCNLSFSKTFDEASRVRSCYAEVFEIEFTPMVEYFHFDRWRSRQFSVMPHCVRR
jgi:hypothetical protein